jgi:hypothetical protein
MLDPLGYATFRRWRLYGQEALAGSEAALWLQEKPLGKHLEKMRGYGESAKHKLSEKHNREPHISKPRCTVPGVVRLEIVALFTALVANHPEFIRYSSVTDKVVVGVAAEITGRSGSWEDRKETGFLVIKVLPRGRGS